MYRPCMHCDGKKYDPEYCPTICTYGEDKKRLDELEAAAHDNKPFVINMQHLSHETQEYICEKMADNDNLGWTSETTAVSVFHNKTNDGFVILVNEDKLKNTLNPDVLADLAVCANLAIDMGYTTVELNPEARRLYYIPWYDYNVPTETTPAYTIEYCYCGGQVMYIKNLRN